MMVRNHGAQLLERIIQVREEPDLETMVLSGNEDQALDILCQSILRLQAITPAIQDFRPYSSFNSRILEMQKHMQSRTFSPETQALFEANIPRAWDLDKIPDQIVLHGDSHHFNLLQSRTRGWLAIDPKGIHGPREYDFAIPLCNPYPHRQLVNCPRRMRRLARRIQTNYGFCADLILQFTLIHALQVAAWSTDLNCHQYWMDCARAALNA